MRGGRGEFLIHSFLVPSCTKPQGEKTMYEKSSLAINPIKFNPIKFLGNTGSDWVDTEYKLSKLITQNVLYATYHYARTIKEISYLLGIKGSLIKDEIEYLEDNGFIHKISNEKYLSHILIHDIPNNIYEKQHEIFTKYTDIICEEYIPKLFDNINILKDMFFFIPDNDINFLKYCIITILCAHKFCIPEQKELINKYFVKRKDGSENLPYTSIGKEHRLFIDYTLSLKALGSKNFTVLQTKTDYDNRIINWNTIFQPIFVETFQEIINNSPENLNDKVNIILSKNSIEDILAAMPPVPNHFVKYNDQLAEEIYNISKDYYPQHMQNMCCDYYKNPFSSGEIIVRILDNLFLKGMLKPITEKQKLHVNTIMIISKSYFD